VGTYVYLRDRLQSVLNAADRLVYSRRTSEHTTPLQRELHWLRVPGRIHFRLCALAYHCVHGTAPAYLCDSLRPTSEVVARRCLCSADTMTLQVLSTRRATLVDRAFSVAAARAWNSLPLETQACSSLLTSEGRPSLTFFVCHTADLAPSTPMVSRRLH